MQVRHPNLAATQSIAHGRVFVTRRWPAMLMSAALVWGVSSTLAVAATTFPTAPIRIIVTLAPGGGLDTMARMVSTPLSQTVGEPVVVDNRPGAGGNIASRAVANSPADGQTLLFTTDAVILNPMIYLEAGYRLSDLVPVAGVGKGPNVLSVHATTPYKTLDDLVTAAKMAPKTIAYGSPGIGQSPHLFIEQFEKAADIQLLHVPYRGSGPAVTDAVGGQIPLVISSLAAVLPHYASGKLRPLAITSSIRKSSSPDIPTFVESGYPSLASENWSGIFAPTGTPQPIVEFLNQHIGTVIQAEDFQHTLATLGFSSEGLIKLEEFQNLVNNSQKIFEKQLEGLDLTLE